MFRSMASLRLSRASSLALIAALAIFVLIGQRGHCDEVSRTELITGIERSIELGAGFLVRQQKSDGTWRSATYGLLKDGTSLTPLVLGLLPTCESTASARDRGFTAISNWSEREGGNGPIRVPPQYPVYTAALVLLAFQHAKTDVPERELIGWRELLSSHQLTQQNQWTPSESRFGGWSYSHERPSNPGDSATLSPLNEPNLSATIFALEALMSDPRQGQTLSALQSNALMFVKHCQNWRENAPNIDEKLNDGGFHFVIDDDVRNKAGIAGVDSTGRTRYLSYGSATADGFRALLLCGLKRDHARVVAARRWLIEHFKNGDHSGQYPADRAHLKPSLDFYYGASVAKAFRQAGTDGTSLSDGRWAVVIVSRLLASQKSDGSWSNPAVDVREDDHLIATSFAIQALQQCLDELRS